MADLVVDKDMGFKKIQQDLKKLSKSEILVGVQSGSKTEAVVVRGRMQKAGINIASYASENEFGTDKIRPRSFLRSFFDENIVSIERVIQSQQAKMIDGKLDVGLGLDQIGSYLQDGVKGKIKEIRSPPNSKKTIALKGSDKPLIDFGLLFASIRYVVKTRK